MLRSARERAHRVVCLSNLKQLTLAWIAYAEENDSKIAPGSAFMGAQAFRRGLKGWLGHAFLFPKSRSELIENPDKGALWPWIKDIDIYRCPRGRPGNAATYTTVVAANGVLVEGTYVPDSGGREMTEVGRRVGSTILRLTRLTDIVSPGAAQRAVFMDMGQTPVGSDFYIHYLYPKWR